MLTDDTRAFLTRLAGREPADHALWLEALTHGSTGQARNYERLEFLGDRVLGLAIAEWLHELGTGDEGKLSQRLNALVSRTTCAEVARAIGLAPHMLLGKQAREDGGQDSDNILGDVMEALLGACFLEQGFEATRDLVRRLWADAVTGQTGQRKHPKSALQEWAAGNRRRTPEYRLVERSGPDHAARFTVEVAVKGVGEAEATGTSKQEAETLAAEEFLKEVWLMTEKCGLVAVIGAPNAGKSTLVNALVGQKVAIVSAKAQTTRARLMGIALEEAGDFRAQIILADTPGIFAPKRRLDRAMVAAAWDGAQEADAILLVVDARKKRRDDIALILEALKGRPERKLLVLNKVDACTKEPLLVMAEDLTSEASFDEVFFVSALTGDGIAELKLRLAALMPEGPWHYPEDQVSDASERLLAAEITREQLYRKLHDELPYASAVRAESYSHRKDGSVEIHQQIVVARDSQKAIVLGKRGAMIKAIGEAARKELAALLDAKVHLFLHVKVEEGWAESRDLYEQIGLEWVR